MNFLFLAQSTSDPESFKLEEVPFKTLSEVHELGTVDTCQVRYLHFTLEYLVWGPESTCTEFPVNVDLQR